MGVTTYFVTWAFEFPRLLLWKTDWADTCWWAVSQWCAPGGPAGLTLNSRHNWPQTAPTPGASGFQRTISENFYCIFLSSLLFFFSLPTFSLPVLPPPPFFPCSSPRPLCKRNSFFFLFKNILPLRWIQAVKDLGSFATFNQNFLGKDNRLPPMLSELTECSWVLFWHVEDVNLACCKLSLSTLYLG